jgi:hypothetical protein
VLAGPMWWMDGRGPTELDSLPTLRSKPAIIGLGTVRVRQHPEASIGQQVLFDFQNQSLELDAIWFHTADTLHL